MSPTNTDGLIPISSIPQSNALTLTLIKSEYSSLISTVLNPVKALMVIGESTYLDADAGLSKIQSAKKQVVLRLDEEIRPKYEELEKWYGLKRELVGELEQAEIRVKGQMTRYKLEESKRITDAKKKEEEEVRRLSQQAQSELTKASDNTIPAIERARAKFKATQVVEEAKQVAQTLPVPTPVKGSSSTFIPTETWKVVNLKAFLKGVIDGTIPEECVMVQVVNVNRFWKMNKGKVKGWPGVEVESGGRVAGR